MPLVGFEVFSKKTPNLPEEPFIGMREMEIRHKVKDAIELVLEKYFIKKRSVLKLGDG
jgi:hypothetical protein